MLPGQHLTLLGDTSPTGTVTVSFTSIPQTYDELLIRIPAASTVKTTGHDNTYLYYNADTTGTNYFESWLRNLGATPSSGEANNAIVWRSAGANIEAPSFCDIRIPNYAGSEKKYAQARGVIDFRTSFTAASLFANYCYAHSWNNTAAITQVDLVQAANNWNAPSRVLLYGISYSRP